MGSSIHLFVNMQRWYFDCLQNVNAYAQSCENTFYHSLGFILALVPELFSLCSHEWLSGRDWVTFLSRRHEYASECPWNSLWGNDLSKLLQQQPQLAEYCNWQYLSGKHWFDLLSVQPHLQQYCPADKQTKWSCDDWRKLTIAGCEIDSCKEKRYYKELFQLYCIVHIDSQKYATLIDWENMTLKNMHYLVTVHPEYAEKLNWKKIVQQDRGEYSVFSFLHACPASARSFIQQMPEKINEYAEELLRWGEFEAEKLNMGNLSAEALSYLVLYHHETYLRRKEKYKISRINEFGWVKIMKQYPEMAVLCPWQKISNYSFWEIFTKNFSALHHCSWEKCKKISAEVAMNILVMIPEYESFFDIKKLKSEQLALLLSIRPDMYKYCTPDAVSERDLKWLLPRQPQLLKFFSSR